MIGRTWHLANTGYTVAAATAFLLLAVCLGQVTKLTSSVLTSFYRVGIGIKKCTWKYFRKKALTYNKIDVNVYCLSSV